MELAEVSGHTCTLKAKELSLALMEEEEHAYEDAICEGRFMESMQSLRPLLMREEGNSSETSFLNPYDMEHDILLSCLDLSSSPIDHQDTWSLDPLHNEPSHYPTWIQAININEEFDKPINTPPSIHASQSHEDFPNSHKMKPSLEVSTSNKQLEGDCSKHRSSLDQAISSSNGESRKRLLDGEKKWPHLHSFLKGFSNQSSITRHNVDQIRNDSNIRGGKSNHDETSKDNCEKKGSGIANDNTSNDNINKKSLRFSKGGREDEGGNKMSNNSKDSMSRKLVSERKRRQKYNEKLYSLRALVPNISKFDVTNMEEQLYQLRIHCKKSPSVLLQLTRALESLEFEIVNANVNSINDHIFNTLVIKVNSAHLLKSEDVRERTLEVIPKFGLFMSS